MKNSIFLVNSIKVYQHTDGQPEPPLNISDFPLPDPSLGFGVTQKDLDLLKDNAQGVGGGWSHNGESAMGEQVEQGKRPVQDDAEDKGGAGGTRPAVMDARRALVILGLLGMWLQS